jgi:hypothetical protein
VLKYLPYAYLARFPLITALFLIALPPLSLFSGLSSLFRGLFDVTPWGGFFLAMGSLLAAWTVMITGTLIGTHAWRRFGVQPIGINFPPGRIVAVLFGFLAVPACLGAIYESERVRGLFLGLVGGIVAATLVLWAVDALSMLPYFQNGVAVPGFIRARASWQAGRGAPSEYHRSKPTPGLGVGYVDEGKLDDFPILRGHGLAASMFAASSAVYLAVGFLKFLLPGQHAAAPAVGYVLLLTMMACWGLSGITFFLDRYRVPVILPLGLWWLVTSQIFPSDHYYLIRDGTESMISPPELIANGTTGRAIVVATTGGGIQAAAWTTRVIEGLEQKCRDSRVIACVADPKVLGKSIRLISSVSGGSTAAMYLVNEYDPGGKGLPDELGTAFNEATKSSLSDVAWGLVYPDFARTLVPIPWRFDRGWALEQAWQGNLAPGQPDLNRGYSTWRVGANQGKLPGLIFNSTITETGKRLLLNTAQIETKGEATKTFNQLGETNDGYARKDLAMTTAARLSASFIYVTPQARSDQDAGHMADGGYYDNYGMSTLIQWLRQALPSGASPIQAVMVVQIRAFPPDELHDKPRRGWLFQTIAPLDTMLDVRTAGQYAHNRDEFALLQDAKKPEVKIYTSVFEFCGTRPPLSWHLEQRDIDNLNQQWKTDPIEREWKKVARFLNGESVPDDMTEPTLDSLCKEK